MSRRHLCRFLIAITISGIEIVGVLLVVFPLCISAIEHYEDTRKVAGTLFKIRRAHKKDLGKVKDCKLMFVLNLKVSSTERRSKASRHSLTTP